MWNLSHFVPHVRKLVLSICLVLLSFPSVARLDEPSPPSQLYDIEGTRQLAEEGDVKAMYNLGVAYSRGLGVEQNFVESLKWHRRAAEKGFVLAMRSVAMRYDKGEGTERDYVEASQWYRRAALRGDFASMNNLASLYSKGQGVEQDLVLACAWVTLAVETAREDPRAKPHLETYLLNMKRITALLTEAQVAKAAQAVGQLRQQIAH